MLATVAPVGFSLMDHLDDCDYDTRGESELQSDSIMMQWRPIASWLPLPLLLLLARVLFVAVECWLLLPLLVGCGLGEASSEFDRSIGLAAMILQEPTLVQSNGTMRVKRTGWGCPLVWGRVECCWTLLSLCSLADWKSLLLLLYFVGCE